MQKMDCLLMSLIQLLLLLKPSLLCVAAAETCLVRVMIYEPDTLAVKETGPQQPRPCQVVDCACAPACMVGESPVCDGKCMHADSA